MNSSALNGACTCHMQGVAPGQSVRLRAGVYEHEAPVERSFTPVAENVVVRLSAGLGVGKPLIPMWSPPSHEPVIQLLTVTWVSPRGCCAARGLTP
jgi:hypothetical protein